MINKWNGLPIIILGTGGISKEIKFVIDEINEVYPFTYDFLGFISHEPAKLNQSFYNDIIIGTDDSVTELVKAHSKLGVIVPFGDPALKYKIATKYLELENVVFPNIIHPSVKLSDTVLRNIGAGNIVTEGVRFTIDISVGNFNLFNLNSTIGHDTVIGDYNVINPGVTISGNVQLKNKILLGTGVNINQGLIITNDVKVGSGAVVNRDLNDKGVYVGIPARRIK